MSAGFCFRSVCASTAVAASIVITTASERVLVRHIIIPANKRSGFGRNGFIPEIINSPLIDSDRPAVLTAATNAPQVSSETPSGWLNRRLGLPCGTAVKDYASAIIACTRSTKTGSRRTLRGLIRCCTSSICR